MARNCAVIVGINDYDEIAPLRYAKSDAERMRDYFMQDLGIASTDLYFFSDDSPRNAQGRKTQPTYGTLKSFLGDRFETPFLSAGDTLWFYFSGHGMPCENRDYLLPSDGNPRSVPDLAIPIGYVTDRLRRSGADNVVLLIDACRSDGAKNAGMGIGEEKQQGVITFFSCSPTQVSYEIEELQQGAFTKVLLEALRIQGEGNCATVERFYQYLRDRVPSLTQNHKNGYRQTPYAVIEPATKLHYILLPKFANLTDIQLLKTDALHAEIEGDFGLAFQLWMRVNVAAGGTDMQAINAFQRLANKQSSPKPQKTSTDSAGSKTPSAPPVFPPSVPNEFKRESIGSKTQSKKESDNLVLDLPNGVKLELVNIPAGSFRMGSDEYDDEKPIHQVTLNAFRMGKYPITQKQYQAVMGKNPSSFKDNENCPVEQVSWNDAVAFCQKLSEMTGQPVKLPSEAQWEYACRAGSTTKYCFGDDAKQLGNYAWYNENSKSKTHPVGEKLPNAWGFHDLHGNVWEWCEDIWHENYKGAPTDGTAWLKGGDQNRRALRGGSWYLIDIHCRSTNRLRIAADDRYDYIGFRVVV